jgi:hypothetical protein
MIKMVTSPISPITLSSHPHRSTGVMKLDGIWKSSTPKLKSNLKINHLIGKNLNAVLIQIFTTLIAYLLIALFRIFHNSFLFLLELKRLLRYYAHQSIKEVAEGKFEEIFDFPFICCCANPEGVGALAESNRGHL